MVKNRTPQCKFVHRLFKMCIKNFVMSELLILESLNKTNMYRLCVDVFKCDYLFDPQMAPFIQNEKTSNEMSC